MKDISRILPTTSKTFTILALTANIKGLEKNHTYLWFFLIIEFIITNYNRRNTKIDKEKF